VAIYRIAAVATRSGIFDKNRERSGLLHEANEVVDCALGVG
jgi:hypothetical protein